MASKKKSDIGDAINTFEDVMQRASLSNYLQVNRTLISKNDKEQSVIIIVDQTLWTALIDNPEFKNRLEALSSSNPDHQDQIKICSYMDVIEDHQWLPLDHEALYSGKVIKITIEGLEYEVGINKNLIPLKLKKVEYNNIFYTIIPSTMTFILKKRFEYPLEDHGFSMIRLFQII